MPTSATFRVQTVGFKELAASMAVAVPLSIHAHLSAAFMAAGNIVAQQAIENIDPYSTTVADSIKVRMSGQTGVRVVAGPMQIAGLLELGNKGSKGGGTFRHPVFGNRAAWVPQPMHPYLAPALTSKEDAVAILIEDALNVAIADALIENPTKVD